MELIKKKLSEISSVYGEKGFASAVAKSSSLFSCPKLLVSSKIKNDGPVCCLSNTFEKNAFVIIANSGFNVRYIEFILNSVIGKIFLGINKIDRSVNVSTKALKDVDIVLVSSSEEQACVSLSNIINLLYRKNKDDSENEKNLSAAYYFLSDLRDYIALELYLKPLFEKEEISILSNWLVEYYNASARESDSGSFAQHLFQSLSSSGNQLVENMYKMRLFISEFVKYLGKK
ncbi:MAG: hypothetical protein MJZ94_01315 [Bacteroidales bacterium]|nr:hypothetical protein [Bacteroidales bacterium]